MVRHRQYLTLTCTRVSPKRPQNQHIKWLAVDYTEYHLISSINVIFKGRSQQAPETAWPNSTLWGQPLHSTVPMAHPHTQPAWRSTPSTDVPAVIKAQLLQKRTQNPHKGHSWYTWLRYQEIVPVGPTWHLLHKTTLPRLEDIADQPNTKTESQPNWGDK